MQKLIASLEELIMKLMCAVRFDEVRVNKLLVLSTRLDELYISQHLNIYSNFTQFLPKTIIGRFPPLECTSKNSVTELHYKCLTGSSKLRSRVYLNFSCASLYPLSLR